MRVFGIIAGALGALALASVASATTYNFSYLDHDGDTINGSFDGTVSGGLVDVTQVNFMNFDGSPFTGPILPYSYNEGPGPGCSGACYSSGGAVVSLTNDLLDNFVFINSSGPATPDGIGAYTNYFYVIPWSNGPGNSIAEQAEFDGVTYDGYNGEFIPANLIVSPAPEAGAWALMLIGLGAMGAGLRARRSHAGVTAA